MVFRKPEVEYISIGEVDVLTQSTIGGGDSCKTYTDPDPLVQYDPCSTDTTPFGG